MSKRRTREKQPNLPKATLDRAREQAGLPVENPEPAEPIESATPVEQPATVAQPIAETAVATAEKTKSAAAAASARRRKISAAQLERSQKRGENTYEIVEYLLENPTKEVTEAQLREEYGYVLRDLRNMGLLAALLVLGLIVAAQIL